MSRSFTNLGCLNLHLSPGCCASRCCSECGMTHRSGINDAVRLAGAVPVQVDLIWSHRSGTEEEPKGVPKSRTWTELSAWVKDSNESVFHTAWIEDAACPGPPPSAPDQSQNTSCDPLPVVLAQADAAAELARGASARTPCMVGQTALAGSTAQVTRGASTRTP